MKTYQLLRFLSAIFETLLAIPILGGLVILSGAFTPLLLALVLHICTLALVYPKKKQPYASILGIVASLFGFIPIIGWILHVTAALALWYSFARND